MPITGDEDLISPGSPTGGGARMFPFPRWESTTHCCSPGTRTVAPMFPPLLLVASLLSVKTTLALVSCKSCSPTYILILFKTIEINFTFKAWIVGHVKHQRRERYCLWTDCDSICESSDRLWATRCESLKILWLDVNPRKDWRAVPPAQPFLYTGLERDSAECLDNFTSFHT